MPELPEVETIIRDLRPKILDIGISKVEVLLPRIVKNQTQLFKKRLTGNSFISIERVGKVLIFYLRKGDKVLIVHLKMTGQLIYRQGKRIIAGGHSGEKQDFDLPNKHTRVIFYFADGSLLFFNDLRTFGYVKLIGLEELREVKKGFGVEPFSPEFTQEATRESLKKKIKARQTSIKAVLLNQEIITGLGNIYVDEVLFRAKVRPQRKASSLKKKEIEAILDSIRPVLLQAIKARGTTFNNYVDADGNTGNFVSRLMVYGRAGEKCKKCGAVIKKIKVAGRGTHYCAQCQK